MQDWRSIYIYIYIYPGGRIISSSEIRGYKCRGTRVLVSEVRGCSAGVQGCSVGVRGY